MPHLVVQVEFDRPWVWDVRRPGLLAERLQCTDLPLQPHTTAKQLSSTPQKPLPEQFNVNFRRHQHKSQRYFCLLRPRSRPPNLVKPQKPHKDRSVSSPPKKAHSHLFSTFRPSYDNNDILSSSQHRILPAKSWMSKRPNSQLPTPKHMTKTVAKHPASKSHRRKPSKIPFQLKLQREKICGKAACLGAER
jgi:hypothetical protein